MGYDGHYPRKCMLPKYERTHRQRILTDMLSLSLRWHRMCRRNFHGVTTWILSSRSIRRCSLLPSESRLSFTLPSTASSLSRVRCTGSPFVRPVSSRFMRVDGSLPSCRSCVPRTMFARPVWTGRLWTALWATRSSSSRTIFGRLVPTGSPLR